MSLFQGQFPELREFQRTTHEAIRQAAREGHRRICVMAPTGSGKTILALNVIRETLAKGNRAMFLCDRKTLISQTSNVAREVGLGNHGIIQAQNPMMDMSRPFQIASCQTLMRRGWPDTDVLVVDECHALYRTWVEHVQDPSCHAFVIGLTATAFAKGMGNVFTHLINAATMAELTAQGILVPMRIFSCRKPNMEGAATSGGEWTEKAAEERELVIVGDVVSDWQKFGDNRKTICFGSTILHCEEIVRQFNAAGIPAATFCADTPDDERYRILREFGYGNIQVLVSVEALAKGFDVKDIGCVCDCRPLRKSLSTAIQMWGRGLRASTETGKKDCILLDFSGNIFRFADDFSRVFYEGLDKLDDGEILDKTVREDKPQEAKACPRCGYKPMGGRKCVGCGYEVELKSLLEPIPGVMQEVRIGKKVIASDQINLYNQLATYCKLHAKAGGNPQGRCAHLFKSIVGEWPPRGFSVDSAPFTEPSRGTLGKIRSLAIAFARGRAAS
jgi:DNA repair protein RadD